MDNEYQMGTILQKKSNRKVFLIVAGVTEEEDSYTYMIHQWNDFLQRWGRPDTVAEGYLKSMYEIPDKLTLLVKFGVSRD